MCATRNTPGMRGDFFWAGSSGPQELPQKLLATDKVRRPVIELLNYKR